MSRAAYSHRAPAVMLVMAALVAALAGCQREQAAERLPIKVRTTAVAVSDYAPRTSLTGEIAARNLSNLSFRVSGRVAERLVEIGAHVEKDQVVARLDKQEQESDLRSAEANLAAAEAQLTQASAAFERQKTLLAQGFTTRREHDLAEQSLRVAEGAVESARSQAATARDRLSYTALAANAPGIVTARTIEAGQVVQAAQTVFTVAVDGDRDAVFNVHEALVSGRPSAPQVDIALLADPAVTAVGEVREVSPAIDPKSGTIRVKVGIANTPPAMQLGAAVVGSVSGLPVTAMVLPWQVLTSDAGKPAVWVVEPESRKVAAAPVEVLGYDTGVVILTSGLEAGQMVVTAGGQLLSSGQVVEIAAEAAK